jgi:hypothetical protein
VGEVARLVVSEPVAAQFGVGNERVTGSVTSRGREGFFFT